MPQFQTMIAPKFADFLMRKTCFASIFAKRPNKIVQFSLQIFKTMGCVIVTNLFSLLQKGDSVILIDLRANLVVRLISLPLITLTHDFSTGLMYCTIIQLL